MASRVISGSARGRRLKLVPGDSTRPIMDRVKENLFNILGPSVRGQRWLDLFAGTGQVGIEALSRGAVEAVFIDNVTAAVKTIQANLSTTQLEDRSIVRKADALAYLPRYNDHLFDVVFVAPPQYKDLWKEAVVLIDKHRDRLLNAGGQVIVQIDPLEEEELVLTGLMQHDRRRYGNTLLLFYRLVD